MYSFSKAQTNSAISELSTANQTNSAVLNCLRSPGLASQLYFSFPVPPGQKGWGEKIIIQLRGS